ncbi:MAG: hypothetical protein LBJ59_02670 [Zoogloeaceae bacterium]|jgi:hypothetical protein|nr:hypothetical protein [Zoogloeaceae bacterium]
MADLRFPKEVEIECQDGTTRTYAISKLPAVTGYEIVTQFPITATPKVGDFEKHKALLLKLFGYIEASLPDGGRQRLTTEALIDNHVPDWEAFARLQKEMAIYNVSFFQNGKLSTSLDGLLRKVLLWITPTLRDFLRQSSQNDTPASAN